MNFKKGDKVKFLNENDYGTVTRVMGNGVVMVLNSDDFEVPAQASQLILDPSTAASSAAPKAVEVDSTQAKVTVRVDAKKPEQARPQQHSQGEISLLAGFVPASAKALDQCDLDFYLVNDSDYRICYNFVKPVAGSTLMETISGILEPDTKEFVETIARRDVGNLSWYKFQLLFSRDKDSEILPPQEAELKLHAPKFYQTNYYKVNDYFDENAVVMPVYQRGSMAEAIRNMQESGFDPYQKESLEVRHQAIRQKVKRSDKEVVDLHLTEIIEDERGMSPKEKLDYQIKVFRDKLDEYIKDPKVQKVVFIHGKGNGTLKLEVRKCLDRHYKRLEYQDASFEEYGGGATLVYVK